jgi:uridine phosphorylase
VCSVERSKDSSFFFSFFFSFLFSLYINLKMKEVIVGANFPRDAEGRVYHIGVKQGDVANRILTVGDHVRAKRIAQLLDSEEEAGHPVFEKLSQRGFLTITGRYKGVPVSIIAM